jgi:hypothetical protein
MSDDNLLPFSFPAVQRKKITAAFDGGRLTSDGGVMLLAQAERRLGIAEQLARVIPDRRDQDRVTHLLPDILRARIFAIACGYEDADDLDPLRRAPAGHDGASDRRVEEIDDQGITRNASRVCATRCLS